MIELRSTKDEGKPKGMDNKNRSKAFQLSNKDFTFICQYVYQSAGIVLNDSKREMLYRRLARIVRDKQLNSFADYCNILRENSGDEKDYFINSITTNLTSFFRENHHFDFIKHKELPKWLKNKSVDPSSGKKRLRIWSSACSTGEEPYSIAITLMEIMKDQLSDWDVKILATDIDSNVLAIGQQGIYDGKRLEEIPTALKTSYFQQGTGGNLNNVKVEDEIKELITFKQLNLLHEWPMKGPFDAIFCRNVIIYFDKKTQRELFARYFDMLAPGGLFFLGHSENLGNYQQCFENVGRTIFRKPI
jgi:chemotaxis protein methyltransferase CheR